MFRLRDRGQLVVLKSTSLLEHLGSRREQGIFITTSSFSNNAADYASKIEAPKVVLIDGQKLAELITEHNVGVPEIANYSIKKLDLDYFAET